MRASLFWSIGVFLLMAAAVPGAIAAETEDQTMVIEKSIEEARMELDEAARKLAELHTRLWQIETEGPRSNLPMLGILVDDSGADQGGVDVVGLTPGAGAEKAGLKAGDRIVAMNGVRLDQGGEQKPLHLWSEAMSTVTAGDPVRVEYVRDGQTYTTEVVTTARGSYFVDLMDEKSEWLEGLRALEDLEDLKALEDLEELDLLEDADLDLSGTVLRVPAGLRLEDVTGDLASYFGVEHGVLVLGTPKRAQPLAPGDVLLEIDGKAVTDADAALGRLAGLEGQVSAKVKRKGREQSITLNADALNAEHALHVTSSDRRIRIQRSGDPVRVEIIVDD